MVTKYGGTIIVCTIALSTTLVNPIVGQVGRHGETLPGRLAVIVQDAKRLRVESMGRIYVIRSLTVQGDHLRGVEENSGNPVEIPMRDIRRLWRRGSAAGTGFIIGGVIGAVGGASAGVALANWCLFGKCDPPSTGEELGAGALGALLGGATGGVLGLLIAAPFQKWKTAYRETYPRVQPLIRGTTIGLRITF